MNGTISKGGHLKEINVSPFKTALKHNKIVSEIHLLQFPI